MDLIDTLNNISSTKLINYDLKYCLVTENKLPFKLDNTPAKSNKIDDFVSFSYLCDNLTESHIKNYKGIGISIQASKICAIDVDKCFKEPFDISSADDRANSIIEMFKDFAYIEFSFSGKGLRILFKADIIENYSDKYYIKNDKRGIEYYQPNNSYRYVTVTGNYIANNNIKYINDTKEKNVLNSFLNIYMKKENKTSNIKFVTTVEENRSYEQLMQIVKLKYFKDTIFQDLWFDKAPGSGSNESERDYHLVAYLFENITQDKDLIKQIFETSPFFKSKDWKHINKWKQQEGRYFNYLYNTIRRIKI